MKWTWSDVDNALSFVPVVVWILVLVHSLLVMPIRFLVGICWNMSRLKRPSRTKSDNNGVVEDNKPKTQTRWLDRVGGVWGLVFLTLALDPSSMVAHWTHGNTLYSWNLPPYNNTPIYHQHWQTDKYQTILSKSNQQKTKSSSPTTPPPTLSLYDLIVGNHASALRAVVQQMPDLLRGPTSPALFRNRHLQLVPWLLQNEYHRQVQPIPFQQVPVTVTACHRYPVSSSSSGAVQSFAQCRQDSTKDDARDWTDEIRLDIFPPLDETASKKYPQFNASSPVIVFSPGLRCDSQDMPGTSLIRLAYGAGFRSIVVNRRGHIYPLQAPRWNLFGDVSDMEQVYWFIQEQLGLDEHTPLFWHGISAGTGLTCSALGIWDAQRRQEQERQATAADGSATAMPNHTRTTRSSTKLRIPSFVASVAVTPGYDTSRNLQVDRFRFPYNPLLKQLVQEWFVTRNHEVLHAYSSSTVQAVHKAETLQELVDAAAPFAGYDSAHEYFAATNPMNHILHTTTPMLVLNSVDDPILHVEMLYETSPYSQHNGQSYASYAHHHAHNVLVAVTHTGSHCPFLDTTATHGSRTVGGLLPGWVEDPLFGGFMLDSWADRVFLQYYQAALKVYHDRRFLL